MKQAMDVTEKANKVDHDAVMRPNISRSLEQLLCPHEVNRLVC